MTVEEIKAAVTRLSAEEFSQFSQWFEEFVAEQWDRQIEADILAGRFDAAGKRAEADFERLSPDQRRELCDDDAPRAIALDDTLTNTELPAAGRRIFAMLDKEENVRTR